MVNHNLKWQSILDDVYYVYNTHPSASAAVDTSNDKNKSTRPQLRPHGNNMRRRRKDRRICANSRHSFLRRSYNNVSLLFPLLILLRFAYEWRRKSRLVLPFRSFPLPWLPSPLPFIEQPSRYASHRKSSLGYQSPARIPYPTPTHRPTSMTSSPTPPSQSSPRGTTLNHGITTQAQKTVSAPGPSAPQTTTSTSVSQRAYATSTYWGTTPWPTGATSRT